MRLNRYKHGVYQQQYEELKTHLQAAYLLISNLGLSMSEDMAEEVKVHGVPVPDVPDQYTLAADEIATEYAEALSELALTTRAILAACELNIPLLDASELPKNEKEGRIPSQNLESE